MQAIAQHEVDTAELARIHPGWFAYHASSRRWQPVKHLRYLSDKLVKVATGEIPRLIVNMPPRHGKSWLISCYFAAWYLCLNPHHRVVFASYSDAYARTWGEAAKQAFLEMGPLFGVTVNPRDSSKYWEPIHNPDGKGWRTTGGYMLSVGKGTGLTGYGAELMIIDDPIKDDNEASSEPIRERLWNWIQKVAFTRLQPDASVVVVCTRWHHDDVIGRFLEQDRQGEGEDWEVLNFPALAEGGYDLLGREDGEALWPEMWSQKKMERLRIKRGSYVWGSLYQGRPTELHGGLFKETWASYYTAMGDEGDLPVSVVVFLSGTVMHRVLIESLALFATVDLATSTKEQADYTVICVWGTDRKGRLFLLDVKREQIEGPDIVPLLWKVYETWKLGSLWIEQVQFQLSLIQDARRQGLPARGLVPKKDKVLRAIPATAIMEGGLLYFPRYATWLDVFQLELFSFPKGGNDDQVDCLSMAVKVARRVNDLRRTVRARIGGAGANRR